MKRYEADSPWDLVCAALLAALLVTVLFQGTRGLYDSTEGRYAECAREMVASGNGMEPTLDFRPHWTKPPLTYWGIAAGIRLLGVNPWGARLFLIPAFMGTILACYGLGAAMWEPRTGAYAALVYATLLGPASAASTVNTDTLLTAWIATYLFAYWWILRGGGRTAAVVFWTSFSLAFLTKGPPAAVPLIGVLMDHLIRSKGHAPSSRFHPFLGFAIFATVGLGWYVVSAIRHPHLVSYWLGSEVVGRIFTTQFHRNPQWYAPFTVYIPFLLGGSLPWIGVAAWIHRKRIPGILAGFLDLVRKPGDIRDAFRNLSSPTRFLLWISVLPFFVFSLSRSRLPLYVLPIFIPIAMGLARSLVLAAGRGLISRRHVILPAVLTVVLVPTGKLIMARHETKRDMGQVAHALATHTRNGTQYTFYLYSHRPHYGLQYHLDGSLRRIAASRRPSPGFLAPGEAVRLFFKDIQKGRIPAIILRGKRKDRLRRTLEQAGFTVRFIPLNRYWIMALPSTPPPRSVGSQ